MRKNIRYTNSDRIKIINEEHKYFLWWFDQYYSSSWDENEDWDRYVYYETLGLFKYEPIVSYSIIDMDSIYSKDFIRNRKIESLLNPSLSKKKISKPTLGDLIKN